MKVLTEVLPRVAGLRNTSFMLLLGYRLPHVFFSCVNLFNFLMVWLIDVKATEVVPWMPRVEAVVRRHHCCSLLCCGICVELFCVFVPAEWQGVEGLCSQNGFLFYEEWYELGQNAGMPFPDPPSPLLRGGVAFLTSALPQLQLVCVRLWPLA